MSNTLKLNVKEHRVYTYPDRDVYKFDNIVRVSERESGIHRLVTDENREFIVHPGWAILVVTQDKIVAEFTPSHRVIEEIREFVGTGKLLEQRSVEPAGIAEFGEDIAE